MNDDFDELRKQHDDLCHCTLGTCACPSILAKNSIEYATSHVCDNCTNGDHTDIQQDSRLQAMLNVREEIAAAEAVLASGQPCIAVEAVHGVMTGLRTRGLPTSVATFEIDYDNFEDADRESVDRLERTLDRIFVPNREPQDIAHAQATLQFLHDSISGVGFLLERLTEEIPLDELRATLRDSHTALIAKANALGATFTDLTRRDEAVRNLILQSDDAAARGDHQIAFELRGQAVALLTPSPMSTHS